jgi:hypothetical protein
MLTLLTAAVLLAHWALLHGAPLAVASFESPDSAATRPFITRTISAPAPAAEEAPPRTEPAPATRPRVAAKALPLRPQAPPLEPTSESNRPLAPENAAQTAIETIANDPKPVVLAAATQTDADALAEPDPTPKPPAAQAARNYAFPASARLKYDIKGEVKGFPYFANGELLWRQDGKTYDARMEISHFLLGSRVQTSTGQLTPHGLEPIRFGDKVRSEVAAHFERTQNKVVFSANTPDVPLLPGAQDHLSVFMQLASMLGGAPGSFPKDTKLPFQAIGPRSSESWVFLVGELENLSLPGGEIKALKLSRPATGEFDPRVEVWLAPDVGYLPVRIRLTQGNGDFVEQQWSATQKP